MGKRLVLPLLVMMLLAGFGYGEDSLKKITFRVLSNPKPFKAEVHIRADCPQLNDFNYPYPMMEKKGEGVWEKTVMLPKGTQLKYEFNLGSVFCSATGPDGKPSPPAVLEVKEDESITVEVPTWLDGGIDVSFKKSQPSADRGLSWYLWKFHPGDNEKWAAPLLDDSAWQLVSPVLGRDTPIKHTWTGVGWFRLHIRITDDSDIDTVGIWGHIPRDVDVYWDGKHILNKISRIPASLYTGGKGDHVIAVRLATPSLKDIHNRDQKAGFFILLGDATAAVRSIMGNRSEQMFFTALMLAFALLHFVLFAYSPQNKGNLYYAVFLVTFAIHTFLDIQTSYISENFDTIIWFKRVMRASTIVFVIFLMRFYYYVFYKECPRRFRYFAIVMSLAVIPLILRPNSFFVYYLPIQLVLYVDMTWVIIVAIREKKEGAWLFAMGGSATTIFASYDLLLDFGIIRPIGNIQNAYYFGTVGLFVAVSVYLARDFACTARKLVQQERRIREEEVSRRLIEADNQRKTKELEDARQLQLSMLPKCITDTPGLDICFSMHTATEVGGDYYDYIREKDGTISIAVGDATGHGMKAGTMVAVIKSLVITNADKNGPLTFFKNSARTIKDMRLGNLFMGLILVKLKDRHMTLASAGMPPVLIYRAAQGKVEEHRFKSPPLGGFPDFPYKEKEIDLGTGDTVLMMSDGFAELFNTDGKMLGYKRAKQIFKEAGEGSSGHISNALCSAADQWKGDKALDDDMTFVILKIKK
ncbi:MAG: SpoIIE family protein phosphatase [bacterium]|nr:SpoIIE family protein phosphatase [bacterium]